eukprot:RCo007674
MDIFDNCSKISRLQCPVMIIHGTADELVGISHAVQLGKRCRNLFAVVNIDGGGHNDLLANHTEKYFSALKAFLLHLHSSQQHLRMMALSVPRVAAPPPSATVSSCPATATAATAGPGWIRGPPSLGWASPQPHVGPWAPAAMPPPSFAPVFGGLGGEGFPPQVMGTRV